MRTKNPFLKAVLCLLFISTPLPSYSDSKSLHSQRTEYKGQVTYVVDGDTIHVNTSERCINRKCSSHYEKIKIRLAGIDAPETTQSYGNWSKGILKDLVDKKQVTVKVDNIDRYNRYVADIYVGGNRINRELVKQGAAWVYHQYNKDKSLPGLEAEARNAKIGLWSMSEADRTAPWEFRRK